MDDMATLGESQEPEGDSGRTEDGEVDSNMGHSDASQSVDAMQHVMPELHTLSDVPASGDPELLPVSPGEIRVEEPDPVELLTEPGREFQIGRKIFTLQRSLCDSTWDVEIQGEGWISTGFPKSYTAGMAEARFRNDFKGGAKKWIARRVQESGRGQ